MTWEPLSRETQAVTSADVEALIGYTRETLHASALIMQGASGDWPSSPPSKRMDRIISALGRTVTIWREIREFAMADKRTAEREHEQLRGRIEYLAEQGGDIAELGMAKLRAEEVVSDHEREHATAEQAFTAAVEIVSNLERAEATHRERRSAVEVAKANLAGRHAVVDRAAAAKMEAVSIQRWLDQTGDPSAQVARLEAERAEMDAQREGRRSAEAEVARLHGEYDYAVRELEALDQERGALAAKCSDVLAKLGGIEAQVRAGDIPRCDRCEQELHTEARERAIASLRAEHEDYAARVKELDSAIAEVSRAAKVKAQQADAIAIPDAPTQDAYDELMLAIRAHREAELGVAAQRQKLAGLQATIAEVTPELTAEVARLAAKLVDAEAALAATEEPEPGALDAANANVLEARARLEEVAHNLAEARAARVRAETALEAAQKIAGELEEATRKSRQLLGELDLLAECERIYGTAGLPAFIVENRAIPTIEAAADAILSRFQTTCGLQRVELRTQREDATGTRLLDALDIIGITEAGVQVYEAFSGGERTMIDFALAMGLVRLLPHSAFLALDELEGLDEVNQAAFLALFLEQPASTKVLASHYPGLRDAPLDGVIELVNVDGRSRTVGSAERISEPEGVAA